jgi:hypothetical protein
MKYFVIHSKLLFLLTTLNTLCLAQGFSPNLGQINNDRGESIETALFEFNSDLGRAFIMKDGVNFQSYRFIQQDTNQVKIELQVINYSFLGLGESQTKLGSISKSNIEMEEKTAEYSNYYLHNKSIENIPTYKKVRINDFYPRIDWILEEQDGYFKQSFLAHPGADISVIKWRISGAKSDLSPSGDIVIKHALGEWTEKAPYSAQDGEEIKTTYQLSNDVYSYNLSTYNTNKELLIDPMFTWSYYARYNGYRITGESTGSIHYSGGWAFTDFVASGGFDITANGNRDIAVLQTKSDGTRGWSTYVGSSDDDDLEDLSCSGNGQYIALVGNHDGNFSQVATSGAAYTSGSRFSVLLNSNGTRRWGSYLPSWGSSFNVGSSVEVTNGGLVLPISDNMIIGRFNPQGSQLTTLDLSANYMVPHHLCTDNNGWLYVVGNMENPSAAALSTLKFGRNQATFGGGTSDAFITKINISNLSVVWSTLDGGTSDDFYQRISHRSGKLYISGGSNSSGLAVSNAFQTTVQTGASISAYFSIFNTEGYKQYASYFFAASGTSSGSELHAITGVSSSSNGDYYVVGITDNQNLGYRGAKNYFSETGAFGNTDGFIAKFNVSNSRLWSTYVSYMHKSTDFLHLSDYLYPSTAGNSRLSLLLSTQGYQNGTNYVWGSNYLKMQSDDFGMYEPRFTDGNPAFSGDTAYSCSDQDTILIDPNVFGTFPTGIQFFYELSDENGSFTNPKVSGSMYDRYFNDTLYIPVDSLSEGQYKFRLRNSLDPSIWYQSSNILNVLRRPDPQIIGNTNYCDQQVISTILTTGTNKVEWSYDGDIIDTLTEISFDNDGIYTLREYNQGCESITSQNFYRIKPIDQPLCMVTVDSSSGKVQVVWEKNDTFATSFEIYRQTSQTGVYQLLHAQLYGAYSSYIDTNSNPLTQSYTYRLTTSNTCNDTTNSSSHSSIHLSSNEGVNGEHNLNWNQYIGFPVATYEIYKNNKGAGMIKIAEIAGDKNTYSVINPSSGSNEYMIGFVHPNGCQATKRSERILSNSIIMGTLGINELKNSYASVYPNPTNGVVSIKSKSSLFGAKYSIYSSKGEQILTGRISGEITTLDIQNFPEGVYLINIDGSTKQTFRVIKQ